MEKQRVEVSLMKLQCYILCSLWMVTTWISAASVTGPPSDEVVMPRLDTPPVIDGTLDDPVWRTAGVLDAFTLPLTDQRPSKGMSVRLGFDDAGLYIGARLEEPNPGKLTVRAADGSARVWKDDCIEVWVRTSDRRTSYEQFIVNAGGARQRVSSSVTGSQTPQPTFPAATTIGADAWTVELHIPFAEIGLDKPQPGDMIQLHLGREAPAGRTTELSTWPPHSSYGAAEGYGRAYFVTNNLLPNADFSATNADGTPTGWGSGEGQLEHIQVVDDRGRRALRWEVPGHYCTLSHSVQLEPNSFYRLEGRVRGTAGIYMRARTREHADDKASRPFTVNTRPGDEYVYYSVNFPTGEDGRAIIILGNTETMGAGEVYLTDLAVVRQPQMESSGPLIPVTPGETLWLTDVGVSDCRSLRGFVGAPVDGRLDSVSWNGSVWEYGARNAGAGVYYDFAGGDGLNITLADRRGVDAVQIRGGARVNLYSDAETYYDPGDAPLVWKFRGAAGCSHALFDRRVTGDRFSFFDLDDGYLSDIYFLRIGDRSDLPEPEALAVSGPAAPDDLQPFADRFKGEKGEFFGLGGEAVPLDATEGGWLHLVTEPMSETGLLAVGLRLNMPSAPAGVPLTVAVMDPFNPAQRVMSVDLVTQGPGEMHIILDHLDQVVPEGRRVWVALRTGADTKITSAGVDLYLSTRERALPEALEYRKWIVKTMFAALSEPRPWGSLRRRDQDLNEWAKKAYAGEKVVELLHEARFAKELGPDDDIVRQYDEWLWRRAGIPEFEPTIDDIPGAPEWAVLAHQAWLAAREVPKWWIENRMVPTGEFGGRVGDDSDMYQNYADFPMISDDEVARAIVDGADRLMELADRTTLEAGLNRRTMDPLHAYEEGMNQEALLLWWHYGDPVYFERCLKAAQSLPALTTVTSLGHRHFKSQECGAEDLRIDRPLGKDGHAHPLMLHPAFEVAWYNRDPRVMQFLREWADGWLEHQKPGEYATMVDVATEQVVAARKKRPFYGGYRSQGSAFMFMYYLSGDAKYLRPVTDYYARGEAPYPSERFLYELYQAGALDDYADKFEKLAERSDLMQAMVTGDRTALFDGLRQDIAEMQRFPHMYTTAEQFTDRIFLYAITRATNCYCGGYATRNKFDHRHACSWEGLGTDFAALVTVARPERFKTLVYNFADRPLTGNLRLWTLGHGIYSLTLGPDADDDEQADTHAREDTVEVARGTRIAIELPPHQTTVIELTRIQALEPITGRPDVALSHADTKLEDGVVSGFVHNIGVASAGAVDLALMNPAGEVVATRHLDEVPGIGDDLEPVRIPYRFGDLPDDPTGWRVVADPDDTVTEITETNNEVVLP
ncbi:MAG: hypothetical protein J7M38_05480 [Armatimonadetes bacterium]|nr:hypothetical protein [Armatimonadota bacterium]